MTRVALTLAPMDCERVKREPERKFNHHVLRRAMIQTALEMANGNISWAADILGMHRKTLQKNLSWNWTGTSKKINGAQVGNRRPYGTVKVGK